MTRKTRKAKTAASDFVKRVLGKSPTRKTDEEIEKPPRASSKAAKEHQPRASSKSPTPAARKDVKEKRPVGRPPRSQSPAVPPGAGKAQEKRPVGRPPRSQSPAVPSGSGTEPEKRRVGRPPRSQSPLVLASGSGRGQRMARSQSPSSSTSKGPIPAKKQVQKRSKSPEPEVAGSVATVVRKRGRPPKLRTSEETEEKDQKTGKGRSTRTSIAVQKKQKFTVIAPKVQPPKIDEIPETSQNTIEQDASGPSEDVKLSKVKTVVRVKPKPRISTDTKESETAEDKEKSSDFAISDKTKKKSKIKTSEEDLTADADSIQASQDEPVEETFEQKGSTENSPSSGSERSSTPAAQMLKQDYSFSHNKKFTHSPQVKIVTPVADPRHQGNKNTYAVSLVPNVVIPSTAKPQSPDDQLSPTSQAHSPRPAYKSLMAYKKTKKDRPDRVEEMSEVDISKIIAAAKRRSGISPTARPCSRPGSPRRISPTGELDIDPDVLYPSENLPQNQFFDMVGLIKKSELPVDDPTKSKLHREGGGRLRRVIKPKMAPQMVYKKIQIAKGCIIRGVMNDSDEEGSEYSGSREASPRVSNKTRILQLEQTRQRKLSPEDHVHYQQLCDKVPMIRIQKISKDDSNDADEMPGVSIQRKLAFSSHASSPASKKKKLDPELDFIRSETLSKEEKRLRLLQQKKTLENLTSGKGIPTVRLFDRPARMDKKTEEQPIRRSSRQRDSKRKEWWHLLRANPDEYEVDMEWEEEQRQLDERRKYRLEKVEELLRQENWDEEEVKVEEPEVEEEPVLAPVTKKKKKKKAKKETADNDAVDGAKASKPGEERELLGRIKDAKSYADMYDEVMEARGFISKKPKDWSFAKKIMDEVKAKQKAEDQANKTGEETSKRSAEEEQEGAPPPKKSKKKKKKSKPKDNQLTSISIVGPDGKFLDKTKCGSLLSHLKPVLKDLIGQPEEANEPKPKEKPEAEAKSPEMSEENMKLLAMTVASMATGHYKYNENECVTPHMCPVCWYNDHMYCSNMKRTSKNLPPWGGCIHYIPCPHYKNRDTVRQKPKPETNHQEKATQDQPPSTQQGETPERRPLSESDLVCDEEMLLDSDSEGSPKAPRGTEFLKLQLKVRASQIAKSLGVSEVPDSNSPKNKSPVIFEADTAEDEGESPEVEPAEFGSEVVVLFSTGENFAPNYDPRAAEEDHGLVLTEPQEFTFIANPVEEPEPKPAVIRKGHQKSLKKTEEENKVKVRLLQLPGGMLKEGDLKNMGNHKLIKVKVQRLDTEHVIIKQTVQAAEDGEEETIIKEIKVPKDMEGNEELNTDFLSDIIAKEAIKIVNERESAPKDKGKRRLLRRPESGPEKPGPKKGVGASSWSPEVRSEPMLAYGSGKAKEQDKVETSEDQSTLDDSQESMSWRSSAEDNLIGEPPVAYSVDNKDEDPECLPSSSSSKALKAYSKNCQPPSAEEKALEMARTIKSVNKATKITQESEETPMCKFIVQGERFSEVIPEDSEAHKETIPTPSPDDNGDEISMESDPDKETLKETDPSNQPSSSSEKDKPSSVPPFAKKDGAHHTLSFTTKEIREKKPELMNYIKEAGLAPVIGEKLRNEKLALMDMIKDTTFLVSKLREDVSQKKTMLSAILEERASNKEKCVPLQNAVESQEKTVAALRRKLVGLQQSQRETKAMLQQHNKVLTHISHLCDDFPDSPAEPAPLPPGVPVPQPSPLTEASTSNSKTEAIVSAAASEVTVGNQAPVEVPMVTAVASTIPPVMTSAPVMASAPVMTSAPVMARPVAAPVTVQVPLQPSPAGTQQASNAPRMIQIPVPVPGQPGRTALISLDPSVLQNARAPGGKGQQMLLLQFAPPKAGATTPASVRPSPPQPAVLTAAAGAPSTVKISPQLELLMTQAPKASPMVSVPVIAGPQPALSVVAGGSHSVSLTTQTLPGTAASQAMLTTAPISALPLLQPPAQQVLTQPLQLLPSVTQPQTQMQLLQPGLQPAQVIQQPAAAAQLPSIHTMMQGTTAQTPVQILTTPQVTQASQPLTSILPAPQQQQVFIQQQQSSSTATQVYEPAKLEQGAEVMTQQDEVVYEEYHEDLEGQYEQVLETDAEQVQVSTGAVMKEEEMIMQEEGQEEGETVMYEALVEEEEAGSQAGEYQQVIEYTETHHAAIIDPQQEQQGVHQTVQEYTETHHAAILDPQQEQTGVHRTVIMEVQDIDEASPVPETQSEVLHSEPAHSTPQTMVIEETCYEQVPEIQQAQHHPPTQTTTELVTSQDTDYSDANRDLLQTAMAVCDLEGGVKVADVNLEVPASGGEAVHTEVMRDFSLPSSFSALIDDGCVNEFLQEVEVGRQQEVFSQEVRSEAQATVTQGTEDRPSTQEYTYQL